MLVHLDSAIPMRTDWNETYFDHHGEKKRVPSGTFFSKHHIYRLQRTLNHQGVNGCVVFGAPMVDTSSLDFNETRILNRVFSLVNRALSTLIILNTRLRTIDTFSIILEHTHTRIFETLLIFVLRKIGHKIACRSNRLWIRCCYLRCSRPEAIEFCITTLAGIIYHNTAETEPETIDSRKVLYVGSMSRACLCVCVFSTYRSRYGYKFIQFHLTFCTLYIYLHICG